MSENLREHLFDEAWYREGGPSFSGDAYDHFSHEGHHDDRDPHPLFDVRFYRSQAGTDLAAAENPLEHFIRSGAGAGLSPHPLFDTAYYTRQCGAALGHANPLAHYLSDCEAARHDPTPFFVGSYYVQNSSDVTQTGVNPLVHYLTYGFREGRRPHRDFDGSGYARRRSLPPNVNPLTDFVLRLRGHRSPPSHGGTPPDVSVIILNYRRALLTLQSVVDVLESSGAFALEVVVVDNGSDADDFALLSRSLPRSVQLIRLATNRFFGEGCNIGVDASGGRRLLFLNNDAFVDRDALAAMRRLLENVGDAGAVGPKLIYPDGTLQECGAMVSSDGTVTQRGKLGDGGGEALSVAAAVDYVSGACLLVPRELFDEVGGFDLAWDPAYYEDVDLCLKLRLLRRKTYYCPDAVVTHIEHATSREEAERLELHQVIAINRERFVNRWGRWLAGDRDSGSPPVALPPALPSVDPRPTATAVLYTPYMLVPGGGERFILSIAQTLSRTHRTVIVTPERYSSYRLRGIASVLGIDLGAVVLEPFSALARFADCDVFVALGNEAQPPVPAFGRRSIFVCQFPFPMDNDKAAAWWGRVEDYDDVVVYSGFVEAYLRDALESFARRSPALTVIAPPCPLYDGAAESERLSGRIVTVGRFAETGHCKRQDVMVDAFRSLVESGGVDGLELHIAGSIPLLAEARSFYRSLQVRASGLPVFFHPHASPDELEALYASSSCYWHATGFGIDEKFEPERLEHFGISVIEAMSAGTIPLVYAAGGPAENVTDGVDGFHWRTVPELVEKTRSFVTMPAAAVREIRERATSAARRFSEVAFAERLTALLGTVRNDGTPAVIVSSGSDRSARVDERDRALAALAHESGHLSQRCRQLEAHLVILEDAALDLSDETSKLRAFASALRAELGSARLNEQRLAGRVATLEIALERMTASRHAAQVEAQEMRVALDHVRRSLFATAAQLDALTGSRSWRLTKPLRDAKRAVSALMLPPA